MSTPAYTAVIVTYNAREVLQPSLLSLLASKPAPAEIIVVDNASSDGTVELLKKEFPQVTVIEAGGNIGFGRGNNLGIAHSKTPYVFLVNNDLKVEPDCAALLLEAMEKNPALAVACPLTYRGWDTGTTSDIYAYGTRIDQAGFTINVESSPEADEDYNCFSGACVMARTDILQKNPFEPHYFLYYEEPELTVRLVKQGYAIGRVDRAVAWHLENYSSPGKAAASLAFRQFYGIQNRWFAIGKHWPVRLLPQAFFFNLLHYGYFLLFFVRNKQLKYVSLVLLAPYKFFLGVFNRSFQPQKNSTWWNMLAPSSLGGMLQMKKRVLRTKED